MSHHFIYTSLRYESMFFISLFLVKFTTNMYTSESIIGLIFLCLVSLLAANARKFIIDLFIGYRKSIGEKFVLDTIFKSIRSYVNASLKGAKISGNNLPNILLDYKNLLAYKRKVIKTSLECDIIKRYHPYQDMPDTFYTKNQLKKLCSLCLPEGLMEFEGPARLEVGALLSSAFNEAPRLEGGGADSSSIITTSSSSSNSPPFGLPGAGAALMREIRPSSLIICVPFAVAWKHMRPLRSG